MTLNFADLTQKLRAGAKATENDVLDMVTAGPGATFALVEFAAEFRRMFFRNTIEVVNLLDEQGKGPQGRPAEEHAVNVGASESQEELAHQIFELSRNEAVQRITVNFLVPTAEEDAPGAAALTPMQCLRVLAAVRIAAPAKSLRVGTGRDIHLRSLQSLALHCVDSLYLSDYRNSEPRAVFEDLKLMDSAGLNVLGAENRDLVADYVSYLQGQGVDDAQRDADEVFSVDDEATSGGCGGNCGCGAGGCGSASAEPEPVAQEATAGGCGCGAGGCGGQG